MGKQDFYETLGVSRDSDEATLKKAYRRMAMKYHPDRNSGAEAEEKFKVVKEAYEVLSDSRKRAAYDQFGHAGVEGAAGGSSSQGTSFNDIFGDVFGDIFGGGRGRSQAGQGSDLRYTLDITLEEAVRGTSSKIRIPSQVNCGSCNGSGAKKGSAPHTCSTCGGHGQVRLQQGFFSVQQTCPNCHGNGRIIKSPCPNCRGEGRVREYKNLSVKVPAGVDSGDRIRLSGEGEGGSRGGVNGDLYVEMRVKPHKIFSREDSNLFCEVPISFATAALSGELEVPTLDGRINLKVPAETQTGKVFRIRGKGVKPVRGGPVGDLLCRVVVETPVSLTVEQKALLHQFECLVEKGDNCHKPQERSWLNGVKQFFERF